MFHERPINEKKKVFIIISLLEKENTYLCVE